MLPLKTTSIRKQSVWSQPDIVISMLKNLISQDPLPLFSNSECYHLKSKNKILSYCVLTEYRDYYQLKDVFTFPQYRRQGFANNLLKRVLSKINKPVYLLCKNTLIPFYQKLGFIEASKIPKTIRWRQACGNFFLQITDRQNYHAMIKI